jgi:hypothetical protein
MTVVLFQTNNLRYPLFTLLIEDGNGIGQPVAFGIMAREDQSHIEAFLEYFAQNNNLQITQSIVVDKDAAEINAIHAKLPNLHIIICYFHIIRAVDRHLSTMNCSAETKDRCCEVRYISVCFFLLLSLAPKTQADQYVVSPYLMLFVNVLLISFTNS